MPNLVKVKRAVESEELCISFITKVFLKVYVFILKQLLALYIYIYIFINYVLSIWWSKKRVSSKFDVLDFNYCSVMNIN